jgi:hypothetical protein
MLVWFFLRCILLGQTAVIMSWRTTIGNHGIIELFTLFVTIHNFFFKGSDVSKLVLDKKEVRRSITAIRR